MSALRSISPAAGSAAATFRSAALAIVAGVALTASAALAGCSSVDHAPDAQATTPGVSATPAAVSVTVQPVALQRVERTVDFVGTLYAENEASVAAEVDGRLTSIQADLGDQVQKGQILATLDGSELEAKLREADATLAKAANDERRAQALRAQGVMSQQETDALVSAGTVARARRDVLAIQVGHSQIRAPFDGRIAKRMVDLGNYVRTGTPLFVLVADNPLRLRGEVPERFAAEIQVGHGVRGFVEAYPDDALHGRLTRIGPAANPLSRALAVEATVPNDEGRLKVGFFCKAQILTRADAEALVVPVEALVSFAGVTRVFVIDDADTARAREVQTGLRLGTMVEITGGLKAGERVATSALARLSDGTKVAVREGAEPPAAQSANPEKQAAAHEPPPSNEMAGFRHPSAEGRVSAAAGELPEPRRAEAARQTKGDKS